MEGSPKRSGINVQLIPAIWSGDGDGDGAEQTVVVESGQLARALTDFPRVICPPPSFPFDRSPFFAVFRSISPLLSLENVPIAAAVADGRAGVHVPADAHKAAVNTLAAAPEREGDRGGKEVTPRFVRHE